MGKLERARRGRSKKGDHLSEYEFNALLDAPVTPQEKIIVALYAWTAARASEVLAATQGDVNLFDDTIGRASGGRRRRIVHDL